MNHSNYFAQTHQPSKLDNKAFPWKIRNCEKWCPVLHGSSPVPPCCVTTATWIHSRSDISHKHRFTMQVPNWTGRTCKIRLCPRASVLLHSQTQHTQMWLFNSCPCWAHVQRIWPGAWRADVSNYYIQDPDILGDTCSPQSPPEQNLWVLKEVKPEETRFAAAFRNGIIDATTSKTVRQLRVSVHSDSPSPERAQRYC